MKYLLLLLPIYLFSLPIEGTIYDSVTHIPIEGATIIDSQKSVYSNSRGSYAIESDDYLLHVKKVGYRPYHLNRSEDGTSDDIYLEPIQVKALYLNFWGARLGSKTLDYILKMVDDGEINAIVMDVKNELGLTSYKTSVTQANAMRGFVRRGIKNIDKFMAEIKRRNIYLIARIVVFKDELLVKNNPKLALKKPDGTPYRNRDKMGWIDPFVQKNYAYVLHIAQDAARVGFDEINFDYVRFPANADLEYAIEPTPHNRVLAIEQFLYEAKSALEPLGVFISANTYGEVCWSSDDSNIGHTISSLAKYSDYIAPMLYPSGFHRGTLGFKDPTNHNYEIIYRSIKQMHTYVAPNRIRPWLQAFRDYANDKKRYHKKELFEQMRAANAANTSGWMFWNPSSRYSNIGLKDMLDDIDPTKHSYCNLR